MNCNQCEMVSINGVACHELGCLNRGKKWNGEEGRWVRYVECRDCGYEIEEGESCDCLDYPDEYDYYDYEDEDEDDDEDDEDED